MEENKLAIKTYLKSFVSFSIGTWVRAIISFISTPIITYLIVPEEFGRASMYTLVYNIALITSLLGLDQSYVRHYYEKKDKTRIFWNTQIPALFLGIIISLFFILFEKKIGILLYNNNYEKIGILFLLSLITGILQRFNELSIRMQKKGIVFSTIQIINSLGNIIGTISYAYFIKPNFYAIIIGQSNEFNSNGVYDILGTFGI